MVKVRGYGEVEVEVDVSVEEVVDELIARSGETPGDFWRVWLGLVSNAIDLLNRTPANTIAAIPIKTREIVVASLAKVARKFADGVAIDDRRKAATAEPEPIELPAGFHTAVVEPWAIDLEATAAAIADELSLNSGWRSKTAVAAAVLAKLREARQ